MDNAQTQSMVAYEDGPKEVNNKRGLHDGNKQFGNGDKMPQDERKGRKTHMHKAQHGRHTEHR